jgi:outer membrane biosynthesis protein TonB
MFTSLHTEFTLKQPATFASALLLQCALLVILCSLPFQRMSGPCLRPNAMRSVTPIYFQQEPVAVPSVPKALPMAKLRVDQEPPPEVKPDTKVDVNAPATTSAKTATNAKAATADDGSGSGEDHGVAPFASWQTNSASGGSSFMHHEIKNAMAVYTPDPPILHDAVPELARGKDVVMDVVINDQGAITEVAVLQGVGGGVERSIVETLSRWIYVPAKINGVAIASRQELRFHFPG